jgi:hypothetical protein
LPTNDGDATFFSGEPTLQQPNLKLQPPLSWPEIPNTTLTSPKSLSNNQIDTQNEMNKLQLRPNDTQHNQTKPKLPSTNKSKPNSNKNKFEPKP